MEQRSEGLLSEESLVGQRRRQIDSGLGGDIVVRALEHAVIVAMSGQLLDVASLTAAGGGTAPADLVKGPRGQAMFEVIEKVVRAGCVSPKLGTDPAAGPVVADLPIDVQLEAFTAILEMSGYSKKNAEAIRP